MGEVRRGFGGGRGAEWVPQFLAEMKACLAQHMQTVSAKVRCNQRWCRQGLQPFRWTHWQIWNIQEQPGPVVAVMARCLRILATNQQSLNRL